MRRLRPEYYSDTQDRTSYVLDAKVLEYTLNTITSRNETHEFEVFCRKLCERAICPNLRPHTGPEGGGDSKVDTETIPVSDEISSLTYVGEANAGTERWAFAFSAKKKWIAKIRSDVAGILGTSRDYKRIICVTNQFARAKDRAALEDALSRRAGVPVTIYDRSWIVEQIVDHDRKDLAFDYLGVGEQMADAHNLGPTDYSRASRLAAIERQIENPTAFERMEQQRVSEALVAAKLSRNLERPRAETDGRFIRAINLAQKHGTFRQRLEAQYECLWTAFWWFDDVDVLNQSYAAVEKMALPSEQARDLELLSNLLTILFSAVRHGLISAQDADIDSRAQRAEERFAQVAALYPSQEQLRCKRS
jgi:hypothetical protein